MIRSSPFSQEKRQTGAIFSLKPLCRREPASHTGAAFQKRRPEQFYKFLRRYDVLDTKDFSDHHIYTKDDVEELKALKEKYGAKYMITTEKDAVKLKEILDTDEGIFALKLKPVLDLKGLLDE